MAKNNDDIVVIGAGISGLACAQKLVSAGRRVIVLEARDRIGGRIHTIVDPSLDLPIELGAEFIHGVPREILDRLEAFGASFHDTCDNHLFAGRRDVNEIANFWGELQDVMNRLKKTGTGDRSARDFLDSEKSLRPELREIFEAFVEGFHAADLELLSERGLWETEQTDEATLNGASNFRPVNGYAPLLRSFLAGLDPENVELRLNSTVTGIEWKKGQVIVRAQSSSGASLGPFHARAVVISVPLGVLQAEAGTRGAIEFDPFPEKLRPLLASLEMGHAQRMVFRFRTRFWEGLSEEPIGFLHSGPGHAFPTWWTTQPLRSPLLIAWQGGPKAREMSVWTEEKRVQEALKTLAFMTKRDLAFVADQLVGWKTHDWTVDPFSRGAYSFVRVGGIEASREWGRSIESTLFFAGEATIQGPNRATVQGALESGVATALRILGEL